MQHITCNALLPSTFSCWARSVTADVTINAAQPSSSSTRLNSDLCCAQVSMNGMMGTISGFDKRQLPIRHIPGPEGVRGRNSDNALILEKLGWEPTIRLADGLQITYGWIKGQLAEVTSFVARVPAFASQYALF